MLPAVVLSLLIGVTSATEKPPKRGRAICKISLIDSSDKHVGLGSLAGREGLVVVLLSFECPVASGYVPVLAEMSRTYSPRGWAFVGIDPFPEGGPAAVARQARERRLPFPVFADETGAAVEALQAVAVPEAFVLDRDLVVRYQGRIDDGCMDRLRRRPATVFDLRDALDDLLAGRPVRRAKTTAIGCPVGPALGAPRTGDVTFHRDVVPILQAHCQECHRPGEAGRVCLQNYAQALRWASDIKALTQDGRMPPWKPVGGLPCRNERRLTAAQRSTLATWAENGAPEGDPRHAPRPRRFAEGWALGEPDLVLTVPEPMSIGASGPDLFRAFVLPSKLHRAEQVVAVEVRPGNRRVVHHALVFFDSSGKARARECQARKSAARAKELDQGPGYSVAMGIGFEPSHASDVGDLGAWAPGQGAWQLPKDTAYLLPRSADVVLQLHYHRTGEQETDRTSVGLYFARGPARHRLQGLVVGAPFLQVPAGQTAFKARGAVEIETACRLRSLLPHMHRLGRSMRITLRPPDGKPTTILVIDDWDYRWQETYQLREPLAIPAGDRIEVDAVFDNSEKNPDNPHRPPRPVVFGDAADDEMCFVFLGVTGEREGPVSARLAGP